MLRLSILLSAFLLFLVVAQKAGL
uniref:Uncharacterized protein n=1 Tax=Rhizophora mucronata TaxID=61149 RepID=A0A2P2NQB1_RHIMU